VGSTWRPYPAGGGAKRTATIDGAIDWPSEVNRPKASSTGAPPSRGASSAVSEDASAKMALERVIALLTRTHADHLVDGGDPDLAVTDLAGASSLHDGVGNVSRGLIGDEDLEAH